MCEGQSIQRAEASLPVEGVQRPEVAYAACSVAVPVDWPAGHERQVVDDDAPTAVEYFATGQDTQLSAVIPTVVEYLPAIQRVQTESPVDDHEPAAQSPQEL